MTLPDLSKVTAILPDLADYVVYAAIAIVTFIGVFKCLIPLWGTTGSLRRAVKRLQDHAGDQECDPQDLDDQFQRPAREKEEQQSHAAHYDK